MRKITFCCFMMFLLTVTISSGQEAKKSDPPMVLIPGGEFAMGKDSENRADYSPAHKVTLDAFYMDRHQVTNSEYQRFCDETGHSLPEFWNSAGFRCGEEYPDHPVIGVTWWDAQKYAKWAGKRLPTEAEWEYAARGGLAGMDFPNGKSRESEGARQDGNRWNNLTDPVEKYAPNGFGLYGMSGNVWEWVADGYSAEYYRAGEINNPRGPEASTHRVIRGGSWHSGPTCQKVYYRQALPGHWCDFAVGFRCVKEAGKK